MSLGLLTQFQVQLCVKIYIPDWHRQKGDIFVYFSILFRNSVNFLNDTILENDFYLHLWEDKVQ